MQDRKLETQRLELKFLVTEDKALLIREYLTMHLELDRFGTHQQNDSYTVHSVYLDSDNFHLYKSAANDENTRFKLRLRFYNDDPDAPVFFELKCRIDRISLKKRAGVKRAAAARLLHGQFPDCSDLTFNEPNGMVVLDEFLERMRQLGAKPKIHVSYVREAWLQHEGNCLRVTMDRMIRAGSHPSEDLSTQMEKSVPLFGGKVVLEIKFTDNLPFWLSYLICKLDLQPSSAAKYVESVNRVKTLGQNGTQESSI